MIEVKVTVEIPGLSDAINALAAAIENNHPDVVCKMTQNGGNNAQIANAGTVHMDFPPAVAATPTQETAAPVAAPTPADAPDIPETPVAPSPAAEVAPPPAPAFTAPAVSMEAIGRAGAALVDAGKMPQLIALLGKYGVQAITQLKPEMLDAFAGELRALGAKI